jgi:uncharacterized protein (DUF1499 family)
MKRKNLVVIIPLTIVVVVTVGIAAQKYFVPGEPGRIGLHDGRLSPLPDTPNAVASYAAGAYAQMEPLTYHDSQTEARERLVAVIEEMPRTKLIDVQPDYVYATFRSSFFGFVDDVEFLLDDAQKIIQFRSASRLGYGDIGANKQRMEEIRRLFQE